MGCGDGTALLPHSTCISELPAALLALVLLLQPGRERREIFEQGFARHLAGAGEGLQRIRPGLGRAHFEHGVQPLADFLVVVEGAAMEWSLPAGLLARQIGSASCWDRGCKYG